MEKKGRKLVFATPEELEQAVEKYFESLMMPVTHKGEPLLKEDGTPYLYWGKPATMTGLARAIGLKSRQAVINYEKRSKGFRKVVEDARMRVEEYCETRLFDKDGCGGAKFNLINNFGWNDKKEVDLGANEGFRINVRVEEK